MENFWLIICFERIDSCDSVELHLAKTKGIETGKSHENAIEVAHSHVPYNYFTLCFCYIVLADNRPIFS